jgi:hypothetical protein
VLAFRQDEDVIASLRLMTYTLSQRFTVEEFVALTHSIGSRFT